MRHQAFFEALAKVSDDEPAWDAVLVGYFCILIDNWQRLGPAQIAFGTDLMRLEERNEKLAPLYVRYQRAYRKITQTLTEASDWSVSTVITPILNLGCYWKQMNDGL